MAEAAEKKTEARQKKRTEFQIWMIGAVLVLLPWLSGSSFVWSFSRDTFVVPLSSDVFSLSFDALGHHRIVYPTSLMHFVLVMFAYLGPFVLLGIFTVCFFVSSGSKSFRLILALILTSFVYLKGAPGFAPRELFELLFFLCVLFPFFQPLHWAAAWILASTAVAVCALAPSQQLFIFWAALSLSVGHLLGFLLAERSFIKRKYRKDLARAIPQIFGFICLGFWILFSLKELPADQTVFIPSHYWWMAWVVSGLVVLLSWLEPWQTHRWLALALFSHSLLLSRSMEIPVFIATVFILQRIIARIAELRTKPFVSPRLQTALEFSVALACIGWMSFQTYRFHPQREFQSGWISALREIQEKHPNHSGLLVIGDGLSFFASFVSQQVASSDDALLFSDEKSFSDFMDQNQLSNIVVEKTYLVKFWRNWILKGEPPEISNRSIISRLVSYDGKEVKTTTLNLPAVNGFEEVALDRAPDFVWIQRKKDSSTPQKTPN